MPALMNSSVGSFTGITEAAPICWCCLEVKNSMNVWRISSPLAGRFMLPVFRPAMARANTFSGACLAGSGPGWFQAGLVPPPRLVLLVLLVLLARLVQGRGKVSRPRLAQDQRAARPGRAR